MESIAKLYSTWKASSSMISILSQHIGMDRKIICFQNCNHFRVKIFERNPTGYEKSLVGVQLTLKHELHELHQGLIWWLEVKDNVAVTAGDDGQIKCKFSNFCSI